VPVKVSTKSEMTMKSSNNGKITDDGKQHYAWRLHRGQEVAEQQKTREDMKGTAIVVEKTMT